MAGPLEFPVSAAVEYCSPSGPSQVTNEGPIIARLRTSLLISSMIRWLFSRRICIARAMELVPSTPNGTESDEGLEIPESVSEQEDSVSK